MKTHRFDALSFLTGIVIAGIGLVFLVLPDIDDIVRVLTDAGSWLWPVLLIAIGVAVLAPLASRRVGADEDDESEVDL